MQFFPVPLLHRNEKIEQSRWDNEPFEDNINLPFTPACDLSSAQGRCADSWSPLRARQALLVPLNGQKMLSAQEPELVKAGPHWPKWPFSASSSRWSQCACGLQGHAGLGAIMLAIVRRWRELYSKENVVKLGAVRVREGFAAHGL